MSIWNPRLRIGQAEGAKYLAVLRNERFGPGRAEPVDHGQIPSFIRPSRVAGDIRDNDSLFRKRGSAARTSVGTNRQRVIAALSEVEDARFGSVSDIRH